MSASCPEPDSGRECRRPGPQPRSARRSRHRPARRSGCRRRGRPCSRCPAGGCGSRSPSPRRRSRGHGWRKRAGGGQGAGRMYALKPGAGHHLGGVAGEHVGVVAGVVPDDDGVASAMVGAPLPGRGTSSFRYAANPAAARRTTIRFIRLGPAPSAPRRPAVPNSRVPSKRSASSGVGPSVDQGLQLGPRHRIRVLGRPCASAVEQVGGVARRMVAHGSEASAGPGSHVAPGDDQQPGEVVLDPRRRPETDVVAVGSARTAGTDGPRTPGPRMPSGATTATPFGLEPIGSVNMAARTNSS